MTVFVTAAHVAFTLYFSFRLLSVVPFLPKRRPHQQRLTLLHLLCLAILFSLPVVLTGLPFPNPSFYASWITALLIVLRFAYNAPLFDSPITRPGLLQLPRLLLWRLDVLIYLLFTFLTSTFLRPYSPSTLHMLSTLVICAAATLVTFLDVLLRLHAQQEPITIRSVVAVLTSHRTPMEEEVVAPPTVFDTSAFILLTFHWATPTVSTGRYRALEPSDVLPLDDKYTARVAGKQRFMPFWKEQLRRAPEVRPSVFRALFKAFGGRLLLSGVLKLVNDCCLFIAPMVLRTVRSILSVFYSVDCASHSYSDLFAHIFPWHNLLHRLFNLLSTASIPGSTSPLVSFLPLPSF